MFKIENKKSYCCIFSNSIEMVDISGKINSPLTAKKRLGNWKRDTGTHTLLSQSLYGLQIFTLLRHKTALPGNGDVLFR